MDDRSYFKALCDTKKIHLLTWKDVMKESTISYLTLMKMQQRYKKGLPLNIHVLTLRKMREFLEKYR